MAAITIQTTQKVIPQCYAYTLPGVPSHEGWTKIGFTERDVETRINEQTHTAGLAHKTWWHYWAAYVTNPFGTFTDKDFHRYLKKLGVERKKGTEWFLVSPKAAKGYFRDFTENHGDLTEADAEENEALPYTLREEQKQAVEKTMAYFRSHPEGEFLWNAKPRFGKTLSAYDLCFQMNAQNILIVTNRPAIANSWYSDYETFFGPQSGYLFVSTVDGIQDKKYVLTRDSYLERLNDEVKGCIEFVSLQDLKGSIYFGGAYDKLEEVSKQTWDILIVDEAHEGVDTWKTNAAFEHIQRKWTLHLSGTPFKALANDKFPPDAIYNWTYADEQKKKRDWDSSKEEENPYAKLPKLSLYTYQMSEVIRDKVSQGIQLSDDDIEEYAFDLNEFFATNAAGKFIHDADVDTFLDALTKQEKFPFSTPELRNELKHTFWLLNRVASAKALAKKLKIHPVFKDYEVILAAGDGKMEEAWENAKSFDRVQAAIHRSDKTITLSVGQLTTGVTIPEWTAVLMLSNMASPALYMQAAFRAQNPCLFQDGKGNAFRKENAYVFDFDPARTLSIFEQFANDLIPETSEGKGSSDQRESHVRELLNFFPVYGEDEEGAMIELDAEKVLTIPRKIYAKEIVDSGFRSNLLFSNISNIFGAPKAVIDIINNMEPIEVSKGLPPVNVDEHTGSNLSLNEKGEVEIPEEQVIGTASQLFGEKIYGEVDEQLANTAEKILQDSSKTSDPEKESLEALQKQFSAPIKDTLINTAKKQYGKDLKKSTQNRLEREIQNQTNQVVSHAYGEYKIKEGLLQKKKQEAINSAYSLGASMQEITKLEEDFQKKQEQNRKDMLQGIQDTLHTEEVVKKATETIVKTVETAKKNEQKTSIEGGIRDHLRGFSRTIPAFLMAYGDEHTTLANFDTLVPAKVFWEVTYNPQKKTGVTLDDFRFLRDGGPYTDEKTGEVKHFAGHLFNETSFNDGVKEFIGRRTKLANYFEADVTKDIFDYIPPQQTNQIFTPKWVVKDMVNRLEEENPGCFDNPDYTFADLYMKSGMYITEIVTRLFQSPRMKELFPDERERLNHIFAKQVYGCAPTEIIYRICLRYILGFDEKVPIATHHIVQCDTLPYAQNGTLRKKVKEIFDL